MRMIFRSRADDVGLQSRVRLPEFGAYSQKL